MQNCHQTKIGKTFRPGWETCFQTKSRRFPFHLKHHHHHQNFCHYRIKLGRNMTTFKWKVWDTWMGNMFSNKEPEVSYDCAFSPDNCSCICRASKNWSKIYCCTFFFQKCSNFFSSKIWAKYIVAHFPKNVPIFVFWSKIYCWPFFKKKSTFFLFKNWNKIYCCTFLAVHRQLNRTACPSLGWLVRHH